MSPQEVADIVRKELASVSTAAEVAADSAKLDWRYYRDKWLGYVLAFFSPVQSLFTARTIWIGVALYVLAKIIGKGDASAGLVDLRVFAISVLWAVVGIAAAVYGRKFLIPDVKLSDWYGNIMGARDLAEGVRAIACAIVIASIHLVQIACILVIAIGTLRSGV